MHVASLIKSPQNNLDKMFITNTIFFTVEDICSKLSIKCSPSVTKELKNTICAFNVY